MLDSYNDVNLSNPPHFVYADMHGNLKLKMTQEVEKRTFFSFASRRFMRHHREKPRTDWCGRRSPMGNVFTL